MRIKRRSSPAGRKARPQAIRVFPRPGNPQRATLRAGSLSLPCALGRSGVTNLKREGDGATPAGRLELLSLWVRTDRIVGRPGAAPFRATRPDDGWCDDPKDGRYNSALRLPSQAGHERMWRDDRLYDLVGVLDWNIRPRSRGRGSAIFLHLARDGFRPTEGCIALRRADLIRLLASVGLRAEFLICAKSRKLRR